MKMKSFAGILCLSSVIICLALAGCASVNQNRRGLVRLKEPRLKPLAQSEWTEEQQKILTPLKRDGRVFNIFTTTAHHPNMMESWLPFTFFMLRGSTLPARDRELLILRIGWLCQSEYEFGQHTRIGKTIGLTPLEIIRITEGPDAPGWTPFDRVLLRAADELHADTFISEETWKALAQGYDEKQLMDVVMTVGQYNLVSMFLNTFGVQLDPGIPGFPERK